MKSVIRILPISFLLLMSVASYAAPKMRPYIVLTDKTGISDTLYVGESGTESYEAPLNVVFDAGVLDVEPGTSLYYQWRVSRSYTEDGVQKEEEYLVRQEGHSEFPFGDDGDFTVNFAYSYREPGSSDIQDGDEQEPISFSIDASDLYVPNAFSPNGDGKNDVFKVRVKSIVAFKAVIFNRWGKVVASGDESSLEYESGSDDNGYFICWDGYINGKVAPDGVYFINIEAVGAGGKRYTRKSDINVLKGTGVEISN